MTAARYIFPLITLPYLTRVLEPDLYGVVIYMMATMNYFHLLLDYGFTFSSTKDIAEHSQDNVYVSKALGTVIQAKTFLLLISIIALTAIIPWIPILRENIFLSYLFLGSVAISILLPDFLFRGLEQMSIITNRFVIARLVSTVLTFVLVKNKQDMFWIPILSILGSIVAVVWTWWHIRRVLHLTALFQPLREVFKTLKDSSVYFIATFATTAFGATNTFLLGVVSLPVKQIAFWGICYQLITAVQSLYNPITSSLYPHMVKRRDFKLVKKILFTMMSVVVLGTVLAYVLSNFVISVIAGHQYIESAPIFRALLPVLVFSFPAQVIGFPVMGVMGLVKETTTTTVIASIFHVVCMVVLILLGQLTVLNVAVLRSITEGVLLFGRMFMISRQRYRLKHA